MFNFTRENCANYNIFWQKLRVENVLLLYLEQIVSFWAVIFSNTNSLKLFYENPSLNMAIFTDRLIFLHYILKILPKPKISLQEYRL